jgi:hypothetical protein
MQLSTLSPGFRSSGLEYAPIRMEHGIPALGLIVAAVRASTLPRSPT